LIRLWIDPNLIRRDKEQRIETPAEIEAIRKALIEGEKSGMSDRTPQQIVESAKKRLKANGKIWTDPCRRC